MVVITLDMFDWLKNLSWVKPRILIDYVDDDSGVIVMRQDVTVDFIPDVFSSNATFRCGSQDVTLSRVSPESIETAIAEGRLTIRGKIFDEDSIPGEFAWFATDSSGQIALFSTAGAGAIPVTVRDNFKKHVEHSDSIETPRWGTPQVWLDYAAVGLYVYDWDLCEGPYVLKCQPSVDISPDLKNRILSIPSLLSLDIEFGISKQLTERQVTNQNA